MIKKEIIIDLTDQYEGNSRKSKKRVEEIRNLFNGLNNPWRRLWQAREQKSYDFFLNDQLAEDEKDDLESAGMPNFIINRITPVIETMKYFVTASSPKWKAVGVDGSDSAIASIYTDIIDYAWYISDGRAVFSRVVQDALTKGKGYFHIYIDKDADRGNGEVKIESVDPFDVFTAPTSASYCEGDANVQIIRKILPRHTILRMYPEQEKKIKKAASEVENSYYSERDVWDSDSIQPEDITEGYDPTGKLDDMLTLYWVYEPVKMEFYNVEYKVSYPDDEIRQARDAIDGEMEAIQKEYEVQRMEKRQELIAAVERGEIIEQRMEIEMGKFENSLLMDIQNKRNVLEMKLKEKLSETERIIVSEEEYNILKEAMGDLIISAEEFWDNRIKKTCIVGDKLIYEYMLNISKIPLVAIPYMHTGTPYPMSAVTPLVGKQREINKAHQIMIHNANLASNLRWLVQEGEIDDDQWDEDGSRPNARLYYRPGFSQSGPREIMPQNINNAFFTIEQDSKSDLEYMAGIQPPSMGIGQANDETYRGFLAKDEYGTRRIRSWVSNIVEPGLEELGAIFTEMAQLLYTKYKIFRIAQPDLSGGIEDKEVAINVPLYDDYGNEIGRWNDYETTRYDLRLVAGSTLPISRWATLEEYKQYLQFGVIDDIAFLAETDIKNKESIMQRNSMLSKLQQEREQLEEKVKNLEGTIETLERQVVQSNIKAKTLAADNETQKSKQESLMADKLFRQRLADELSNLKKDIKR